MTTWLHELRIESVLRIVRSSRAETILDLGCGEGPALLRLAREPGIRHIVGMDQHLMSLTRLRSKLMLEPPTIRRKVELVHGSMMHADDALSGFDAAILVETIEHIDPGRLSVLERAVFERLSPETVIITTPNRDKNVQLGVPSHRFRHPDHRFEWGRDKFQSWASGAGRRSGYEVLIKDVADTHPIYAGATQLAVFRKRTGPLPASLSA